MNSRKHGIVTAIGVLVLLIGTAAGAYAMLVMSVLTLVFIAMSYRERTALWM